MSSTPESEAIGRKNLIPFNERPKGELTLIARKGGESKSLAKSEGAKLRNIKERIAKDFPNPADVAWIKQKIEDRPSMAADLIITLEKLKRDGVHPSQRVALLNTEATILKATHGEKIKTENVNINVNVSIEDWEKRIANTFTDEDNVSGGNEEQ